MITFEQKKIDMKRILIIILLVSGCFSFAHAQFNPSNITIGGGLGLQFGDYTLINVAPQIGYNLGSKFNVGGGFTYTYFSEKYNNNQYKQTNSYLGFNLYAKLYPLPFLVVMVQPEANRMWKTVKDRRNDTKSSVDKMIPSCLVGVGLRLGSVTAMLKYDLAQNKDSPYGSRIFYSVGYTFGF